MGASPQQTEGHGDDNGVVEGLWGQYVARLDVLLKEVQDSRPCRLVAMAFGSDHHQPIVKTETAQNANAVTVRTADGASRS